MNHEEYLKVLGDKDKEKDNKIQEMEEEIVLLKARLVNVEVDVVSK